MNELLHEEVVNASRVVLHFIRKRRHLLRTSAVNGREVFLGVGVAVVLQFQLSVRRDDGQLLQVLFGHAGGREGRGGRSVGGDLSRCFLLSISFTFGHHFLRLKSHGAGASWEGGGGGQRTANFFVQLFIILFYSRFCYCRLHSSYSQLPLHI